MSTPPPLRLSASAVQAFRRCPHSYALNYVRPLPDHERVPIASLIFGRVIHGVISRFLRFGGWRRKEKSEIMAMLAQMWDASVYLDAASEQDAYRRAQNLIEGFFQYPYPAEVQRELGAERSVSWLRPRRGILAVGRFDRVCLLPDGTLEVIDYKTSVRPMGEESMRLDIQSLFYRTLAADGFRWLNAGRIKVTFMYLLEDGPPLPATVEYDEVEFLDLWSEVEATAADISDGISSHRTGAPLDVAFPLNRGSQCISCPFSWHCEAIAPLGLTHPVSRLKEETP